MVETLFFGTDSPNGPVSPEQWNAFLADVVTPRFPAGLSTWDASGQWRGVDAKIVRERAHVLQIVRMGDSEPDALDAVAAEYKRRFAQEAVLRTRTPGCASF